MLVRIQRTVMMVTIAPILYWTVLSTKIVIHVRIMMTTHARTWALLFQEKIVMTGEMGVLLQVLVLLGTVCVT